MATLFISDEFILQKESTEKINGEERVAVNEKFMYNCKL